MVLLVEGTVPPTEFVLSYTLARLPDVEIECERLVRGGEGSVLPLLWVRYADRPGIEAVLGTDPSVEDVECLAAVDGEFLFRMEWVERVDLLMGMLTNGEATILDAYGRNERWRLRVMYPDREHYRRTLEFADEHGFTFDVTTTREMDDEPTGRIDLTEDQHEALVLAARRGYFEIPREVTLDELAAELSVTHQALSERLRRSYRSLVGDTLLVEADEETADSRS
jgi:hypothetical protein